MFKTLLVSLIVAMTVLYSGALAQTSQTSLDTAQLDLTVTQLMEAYDIPGVGLAIVEDGEISYVKGYGVRDVATGAAVTPESVTTAS